MKNRTPRNLAFSKFLSKMLSSGEQATAILYTLKWLLICVLVGCMAGSASAFFLVALDWVTDYREANTWIIWLLPIGGLFVGLLYHYFAGRAAKGNNLLLEEIQRPKQIIPFLMAPLVLLGTLVTHLLGGSAGREGTAVQMGGALADQLSKIFKLRPRDRKVLIITGISAGFSSLFGTPLAGAVFGLEVFILGRLRYEALLPSFLAAVIADYVCFAWGVGHTSFAIPVVPELSPIAIFYALVAGAIFGLAGMVFSRSTHFFSQQFRQYIGYAPFRPLLGGLVIAVVVWAMGTTKYIGLGVPTILAAFEQALPWYDSLVKVVLTAFTLGAGFKGGEVTPLFFTGATLGNALSGAIPLPMALLAGMGLVAVFSGATNTPLTSTIMAIELFGADSSVYMALACVVAYLFSGHSGIYGSQLIGTPKHLVYGRHKGKYLGDITSANKE
ncbi:voltage-gated chloride channel family protein [Pontibacter cellulosilyticus]|uniref:Voltage-gated chloride channel family protein n=1 Tax=Pontibacter cellulosilyticus TaxID=1720253 RepID=A0A923N4M0_9BACT|nr:voltage-gated chloride channel family protein [Pontibacter cellulosilyticus]MBC5991769.1 voltage-gated chloride channel family protein [Pontibacter cellulosilyticus]